jgi:PIN domain nuclease of toxin-antitoxin system
LRLLVDTHIVLWRMTADPRLPISAIEMMDDAANQVEVSVVSVWEVAVKHTLDRKGNHTIPMSGTDFLFELRRAGVEPFPITAEHVASLDFLPLHHRDPFDRLLVAQAKHEPMFLLTHDSKLADYGELALIV